MLAGRRMTQPDRLAFNNDGRDQAGRRGLRDYILTPAYLAQYNAAAQPGAAARQQDLAADRAGHRRGHAGHQAARHPGPVATAGRPAAAGRFQRRRRGRERHPGGRSPDQPVGLDQGRRHRRHRPARAAPDHHAHHRRRPQHHPPAGRPGAQRPPARRGAAAGRGGQAQARRERRRERRGAAAAGRPRRDRPGRPGVRPGPADRHQGRGGGSPAAAGPQRRVPQPGPAQPVAAAPPADPARPDGAAGQRPGGAGRPVPARPPDHAHAPSRGRPGHPGRRAAGPGLELTGADGRRHARRHRRGRGLRPGVGRDEEPGGADRFGRRGRHPPAGRAHRERHHAVAALHVGPRFRGHGGPRFRDRGRGPGARHRARRGWPS